MSVIGSIDDSKKYWNHRATTFKQGCGKKANPYANSFIERLGVLPAERVLDMGCATGTLAVSLADAGHPVVACDFAENMISGLNERASAAGVSDRIESHVLAWEDDWDAAGLRENSVDVAVASRCISGPAMADRIRKLDSVAKRRCALTVPASLPPFCEARLLEHLERTAPTPKQDVIALDILADMGRAAEMSFIYCERPMKFDNWDEALMELENLAGKEPLSVQERALFDEYASQHFKENRPEDGALQVILDYTIMVRWAFISWNTTEAR